MPTLSAMNDRRILQLGIPLLSLLITVLTTPDQKRADWRLFLVDWAISLYFTTAFWLGNRALWRTLLRRLPHVDQTSRRLWTLAGASLAFTAGAAVLLQLPLHWMLPQYFSMRPAQLLSAALFDLLPTSAVLLLYEALYFFQQWEANVRRTEQLQHASLQSQLDALHAQLDPHFLFNNLNTLAALIEPTNLPAQSFVEQLADVYRYVLQAQGRPTVPLAEELAFVENYLALHRARFGDKLKIEVQVTNAARARLVAPLSVQLLVENALKHNVASQAQPLHVLISAGEDAEDANFLTVENSYRPRQAGFAPGTGTGLANVRRRYELLGATWPVAVAADAGRFRVRLPLLAVGMAAGEVRQKPII